MNLRTKKLIGSNKSNAMTVGTTFPIRILPINLEEGLVSPH